MSADAVVIGAGIVGAAVADALAANGMRVLVIDAAAPGSGTTSAGMGHVVVMDDSPPQLALTLHSRGLLDEIAAELPAACELDRCGTLWIAADDEQLEQAKAKAARYDAVGIVATVIDGDALARAEPQLRAGLAGAVHVPGDSVISPHFVCEFLLERAVRRGARVLPDTPVLRIEPHAAITADGRHDADVIVNAAGIAAPRLTPGLPVMPRKGHLVMMDGQPGFCRHQLVELGYMQSAHVLADASVAFNVQPRRSGRIVVGSSRELAGHDVTINPEIRDRMLARAGEFMPRIAGLVAIRTWTGLRPATADKLPLIGPWDGMPGLWIAAGHEGLGTTMALGTASMLVDLIHGRTPSVDPAPFSPDRVEAAFSA